MANQRPPIPFGLKCVAGANLVYACSMIVYVLTATWMLPERGVFHQIPTVSALIAIVGNLMLLFNEPLGKAAIVLSLVADTIFAYTLATSAVTVWQLTAMMIAIVLWVVVWTVALLATRSQRPKLQPNPHMQPASIPDQDFSNLGDGA